MARSESSRDILIECLVDFGRPGRSVTRPSNPKHRFASMIRVNFERAVDGVADTF